MVWGRDVLQAVMSPGVGAAVDSRVTTGKPHGNGLIADGSMTYRELFTFDPITGNVRLREGNTPEGARRLVSTYLVSPSMARRLTAQVFPNLQPEALPDTRAVLITGGSGTGKSHLLAALASLAEHAGLDAEVTHADARTVAGDARLAGALGADAIAGRHQVVRVQIDSLAATSLQDAILGGLASRLAALGVEHRIPAPVDVATVRPVIATAMAAFSETFPDQGLLLLVDDLPDLAQLHVHAELVTALNVLADLGEACRHSRFRLVAGMRGALPEHHLPRGVKDPLRRVQAAFEQVRITDEDVAFVIAERLVRKTPEQAVQIEAHLARFTAAHGTMQARMSTFVSMFPIHPDYPPILEKLGKAAPRGVLRTLSEAVARVLEDRVPADHPGLLTDDQYWATLCDDPALRAIPDVEAVIVQSRNLEHALEKHLASGPDRTLARRLVYALAVRRLTTVDIYDHEGPAPAELRDALCLESSRADLASDDPPAALLARVVALLGALHHLRSGRFVTSEEQGRRYAMNVGIFKRFHMAEVVLHWVNAIPFLLLMLTGGSMLTLRFLNVHATWPALFAVVHKCCAAIWLIAMPLTVLTRARVHWEHIRVALKWGRGDAAWMLQSMRSLLNKQVVVPPAGRFNTGQKINALLVMIYFFGFSATGLMMFFKGSVLFPWYAHAALFFSAMGSTGGHLYLALLNPSTRIALGGIFHGWSPMAYIEHHHPLSLPLALQARRHTPVTAPTRNDAHISKAEIVILVITLLLAVVGAVTFDRGRLSSVRKHFSKHFGESIQPRRLSTRHQIGPVTESCVKCHDYTGELPNQNCEACHQDVKERRAARSGFHGTLEGDCRTCHREHQGPGKSIIPPFRDTFTHDQTRFKLEGKHAAAACDDCHARKRSKDTPGIYYLGLPYARCNDCHQDPHNRQFAAACNQCHTPQGWTGTNLVFNHAVNTTFPLEGKHAAVACAKCHAPKVAGAPLASATFKGLTKACADCHQEPHRKQFTAACTTCHTPAGWQGKALTFDHNRDAAFKLVDKHATVACAACHKPAAPGQPLGAARFRGLKSECADCHEDPHRGQFGRACTTCHATPVAWTAASVQFNHSSTRFPLVARHAAVECIRCHKPQVAGGKLSTARFRGLEPACATCHPIQHPPRYGATCTACHTPAGWPAKTPPFDHQAATRFPLAGGHATLACSACHNAVTMGALAPSRSNEIACIACHRKDDPHQGTLGETCARCHGPEGWTGQSLKFRHNTMARFVLNRYHRDVACTRCHEGKRWKPLDASCDHCHP